MRHGVTVGVTGIAGIRAWLAPLRGQ